MDIKELLQQEVDGWAMVGHPAIMQRFVLAHGKTGEGREKPKTIRNGVPQQCFMNAAHLAIEEGYRYVEGYAFRPGLPILIHHGWVLNKHGKIIDNTWKNPVDALYMGVEFTLHELQENIDKHGVYGMLDTGVGINVELIFKRMPELETLARTIRAKMTLQSTTTE